MTQWSNRNARRLAALLCWGTVLWMSIARAETVQPAFCPVRPDLVPPAEYLRNLSLDLRGVVPSAEEYSRLGTGEVDDATIDGFLQSEAFVQRVVRLHREALWPNIDNVSLVAREYTLGVIDSPSGVGDADPFAAKIVLRTERETQRRYRGENVGCLDEPARFDANGDIVTRVVGNARREGWVEVEPYWAPGTRRRVCAFDAQTATTGSLGLRCDRLAGMSDPGCGCGPNLRWCVPSGGTWGYKPEVLARALVGDVERRIATVVRDDRPYLELFTSPRAYVNGPLVHFWTHLAPLAAQGIQSEPLAVEPSSMPTLPFASTGDWREITLPVGHAGLLTSPAYLLRFQSNRARASRFYTAFLCQPFQPPAGGLPAPDPASLRQPDLQLRSGCKYCHTLLEPAAAHWGRWAEQGYGYAWPSTFPPARADCLRCAQLGNCAADCSRYYTTKALSPEERGFLGMLKAYTFRRPEHVRHVEQGPRLLALTSAADGSLASCTARRMLGALLARDIGTEDQEAVDALALDFSRQGWRLRPLVRQIVTGEAYRRVR